MKENMIEILVSEDIRLPIKDHSINLKNIVKNILTVLGVYKNPHGQIVSETFFPSLFIVPQILDNVLLQIQQGNDIDVDNCFVNGREVKCTKISKGKYLLPSKYFSLYENLVTFPLSANVIGVDIFPVVSGINLNTDSIRTRKYKIQKLNGEIVKRDVIKFDNVITEVDPIFSCIFNAKIDDQHNPFNGLYYPAFDLYARTYRLSSWVWTNGVIVKVLLAEATQHLGSSSVFEREGIELANRILDFQETEGVETGSFMARWDILNQTNKGITPQLATNDSAFLGSYALLPAYHYTGDKKYLESSLKLGEWLLSRGMSADGQLYMGYRLDTQSWVKNHLFIDSGFTATLFNELYKITNDDKWKHAAFNFIKWYVDNLFDVRNNYFWWNWYSFRSPAKTMFSRGQAWAMDGVLAAYECNNEEWMLDVLNKTARTLIKNQSPEGGWYYHLNKPSTGIDAKGSSIIAYHLLRLYKITRNVELLISVRKAQEWAEKSMCLNKNDSRSFGGIYSFSTEGTMYGARNISSIFLYALCYYTLCNKLLDEVIDE